jgi:TolB protein
MLRPGPISLIPLLLAPFLLTGCQQARRLAPAPTPVQLTREARFEGQPDVSPDGRTILFSAYGAADLDLFTMPVTGGAATLLHAGPGDDDRPRWSPDGRQVAFQSTRGGAADLFLIPAAGGEEKRLTVESGRDESPDWSPDGRRLVFVSDRGGRPELWILTLLSGAAEPLTSVNPPASNYSAGDPDWTGDRIRFTADLNGVVDLYSIGPDGDCSLTETMVPQVR